MSDPQPLAAPTAADWKKLLAKLPPPLAVDDRIVNDDGTPTRQFHRFLTIQREWLRDFVKLVGGI